MIRRTVSVAGNRHVHFLAGHGVVLVGKGESRSDRDLRPDNALSTKKVVGLVVKVHAAALAFGVSLQVAKEFAHDPGDASAADEGDAVAAVAGDPRVFLFKGRMDARGDGLLTVVKVAKAANVARLVLIVLCVCVGIRSCMRGESMVPILLYVASKATVLHVLHVCCCQHYLRK